MDSHKAVVGLTACCRVFVACLCTALDLMLTPDAIVHSAPHLAIHLPWGRDLTWGSPAAGKSSHLGNHYRSLICTINSVHSVSITFECADAHDCEDEGAGESITVTLQRRGGCYQCSQWIAGMS